MKLFKVSDKMFINPELVTCIRIRPVLSGFTVCITLDEDDFYVTDESLSDEEARAQLTELVNRINAFMEDTK